MITTKPMSWRVRQSLLQMYLTPDFVGERRAETKHDSIRMCHFLTGLCRLLYYHLIR
jgi:hypothetical protein